MQAHLEHAPGQNLSARGGGGASRRHLLLSSLHPHGAVTFPAPLCTPPLCPGSRIAGESGSRRTWREEDFSEKLDLCFELYEEGEWLIFS